MAPGRRKAATKAAAAAAAQRKWKVGDLVLAKVKGFPAWPAVVSEPEKWDFQADSKKVFVQFFGTQQIAFCHPIDVEEYNEEKKVSLLGKCHGKGADFVRAVTEINDCFENLKKQDQVSNVNGTEETSFTNENNPEESLTKLEKCEALVATVKSLATGATDDLVSLTEAAVSVAAEDALQDEEMQLEETHSNLLFTETPVLTAYSTRSKSDDAPSQNGAQRRISARRLRSSLKIDGSELQNVKLLSINNSRSSRSSGANKCDRSLRRSKRFVKSSNGSGGHNVGSPSSVSDDSVEVNGSEIMTVDSDTHSYNDGISVDSGCKTVATQSSSDYIEGETEISERLEFQTNNVIIKKKKRKPHLKRQRKDTVVAAKLNKVTSEDEMLKAEQVSPSDNKKLVKRPARDNGDEHLPLVKRARIRMGGPSHSEEQEDTLVNKDENIPCVLESNRKQSPGLLNLKADAPADGKSTPIKGDLPNLPLPHSSPKKTQYWETRKNFVEDEAALPPSKRLLRALEAMSANVAEDSHMASVCSPKVKTHSNLFSSSFLECSDLSKENKDATDLESEPIKDHGNGDSQKSTSQFCVGSNIEMFGNDVKSFVVASDCYIELSIIDSLDAELDKDSINHTEATGVKCLTMSPLNEQPAKIIDMHHVKQNSPGIHEEPAHSGCNAPSLTMSPTVGRKIDVSKPHPEISQSYRDAASVDKISGGSLSIDTSVQIGCADGEGDVLKDEYLSLSVINQDCHRSEFVEEVRSVSVDSNVIVSVTPVKALTSNHDGFLFHSNSISDDQLEDRIVSVGQSSSSLNDRPIYVSRASCNDRPKSVARTSPPISSVCNMPASDRNNHYVEKKSTCSPDVQVHLENAKLAGKSSSKMEYLPSFEAAIRSLTRTKESIGRATRIAIECAKLGCATKVVEILARSLERESSSHKKVDLFFLVDSITQFSRGMKGDGGMYPSAIQALLPRLLLAAAPPGSVSHENHRQCLKVLRVWQERKIIPDPIIRHHIRELDALCGSYPTVGSRRSMRNERAFDDPIREMEGMLVDEYGSNSCIQLPGFCMPPMLRDDVGGSDSDGESFEAVTPEHIVENLDGEKTPVPAVVKRSHILEDVDGELEMEDVAPCEVQSTSPSNIAGADCTKPSHNQSSSNYEASFAPQQPLDGPIASIHVPRSLPPPSHPIRPPIFPPAVCDSATYRPEMNRYPSSQNFNMNERASMVKQPRAKPASFDHMHHGARDNKEYEAQLPSHMPDSNNTCFSDRPTPHLSGRANGIHPDGAYSKGFHLRPPHPAPSNQFSYVQEQRVQSRRDIPPPPQPNRFHTRNADNGNFYRDRDRNKFGGRDNIGECWRPPLPSVSGPCYQDSGRMPHPSMLYNGPPYEPPIPDNRWNYPSRSTNHRHFNPYRPPCEGPIPVANRGPNYWKPR